MQLNLFGPAGLSIRSKMKTLAELGDKKGRAKNNNNNKKMTTTNCIDTTYNLSNFSYRKTN